MVERIKWTEEKIREEALKYDTRVAFMTYNHRAYEAALRRGIIDSVCSHMKVLRKKWSYEMLRDEAQKYNQRKAFARGSVTAYILAQERGILDSICGHMEYAYEYWSDENKIREEAKKYTTKIDFKENSKAYQAAVVRGILDDVCSHMTPLKTYWTHEMLLEEAKKYKTRTEFAHGCPSAYQSACVRGSLDEVCSHMIRGKSGYDPNKPACFYIVRLSNGCDNYIGFGISANFHRRFLVHKNKCMEKKFNICLLHKIEFESGSEAKSLEVKAKNNLPIVDTGVYGFRTEAILESDYPKLKELLDYHTKQM